MAAIAILTACGGAASCSWVLPFDDLSGGDPSTGTQDAGAEGDAPSDHVEQDGQADADASNLPDVDAAPDAAPDADATTDAPTDPDSGSPTGWVDCESYLDDAKCADWTQANPGTVGDGIGLSSAATVTGGFVEDDHVVVAVHDLTGSAILSVALDTGDRTLISGSIKDAWTELQSRGSGPQASFIDVDPNPVGGWIAMGSSGSVISIDPATGDRTEVMQLEQMTCETWSGLDPAADYGVAVDSSGALLVGVSDWYGDYGIVRVTPSECTMVSFAGTEPRGSGPDFAYGLWGLTLHDDAVWVASVERSVMRIELATGNRTWVTKTSPPVGTGPSEDAFESIAHHRGYVWTGALHGSLRMMKIDPSTHVREAFYATSGPASDVPDTMMPYSVTLLSHPTEDLLIALSGRMMLYDPDTGDSNYLSR